MFILIMAWSTLTFALPVEKDPLRPRVPTAKRAMYKKLSSPLYEHSNIASQDVIESGKNVYERACENCHGESGDGAGHSASVLPVKPRDFTNCKFQKKRADGELYYVIKLGSWPMPPMIPLITEQEAWQVIAYIRRFCPTPAK